MTERPCIVQCEHLDESVVAWLKERADVVQADVGTTAFDDAIGRAQGLIVRTNTQVDEALLERAPSLRVVGRAGVGLDNIDVSACRSRSIEVVYTPDANTQAVVEYVLAIMLRHLRPTPPLDAPIGPDEWRAARAQHVGMRQLAELTVGVLGFGRIGSRLGAVLATLGVRVLYHDLLDIPAERRHGCEPVDARSLARNADVISIHVDGRAENRHLIDAAWLAHCKAEVIIINTSRGFIVDNSALVATMRSSPSAHALLDVYDPEPIPADDPVWSCPNVTLTPHLASRSAAAMRDMSWVARDVVAVIRGESPAFPAPA
ncbi:MAG: NAD(P)-dependent oxidoreductase [Planctomycetota bacterium]